MDRSSHEEYAALLLKKREKGALSTEEDAWIQKYLDLGDKVLKPESRLILEKPKANRA
jgi:hypothetical protein